MPIFLPKMLIHLPGEMANSITVPVREKKWGSRIKTWAFDNKNPILMRFWGSNANYFTLNVDIFFKGDVTNLIMNLDREKKVGVTGE